MDRQLVKKAKKGNKKAFDMIIKALSHEGYRLAYYYLKHQADSQDAVALAIEKAYKNIHKLKEVDKFKTWFMSIVVNEAKMIMRKGSSSKLVSIDLVKDKEIEGTNCEERLDLKSALNKLSEENRMILMLKYYEGYTFKEISQLLKIPESTIKTRNYTLLEQLKKDLDSKEDCYVEL